jgi:3-hydroxymyristoyl/3-hydroxydecanoyl-(acyl carrier protein) dehydratase/1-acyl-sn-glycerol-3-phosphate acyltransferase
MDREGLVRHAGGALAEAFDPRFAEIDNYARRVRMPMPPLLLADRVTGIAAEALGMGTGTVWTETDVFEDSWYLHEGRMPAGIMIESGQADLLLASWIGVDLQNRGERVYRLLGCELTYHGELPRPGDTLVYDIHIDGHAAQGDIRLFFFHYDCRIDGELRLSVRHGQAGFFTDAELADSGGILWDPNVTGGTEGARVDAPGSASAKRTFTTEALRAFAQGRAADCFGAGFEGTRAHVRTPRIQADKLLLLSEITEFAPEGGPWGRGYLRAEADISPDDWYFAGHFLNDPCMPGTLMFEGCVQAMSFYMAALGLTIKNDGGRFEPVAGQAILMRCRGQAIPSARRIVYELFVDELIAGPVPTLYADLLCTIDGLKAFHARRVGLRLVPDWPLETWERLPVALRDGVDPARVTMDLRRLGGLRGVDAGRGSASHEGFAFDYPSLLACAWGRPSRAFGPMYAPFDGPRRVARLPGPPYHFMTRVTEVSAPMGQFKAGVTLTAEYDVPRDAWYFAGNGQRTMPSCVLMEAALQPCGWLASYIGSALTASEDLLFRNLDGTGTVLGEVLPDAGTLRTTIKLLDVSRSAGIIIESFLVECFVGETAVYRMRTVFGFFPRQAFENQAGLPVSDEDRARVTAASAFCVDLRRRPARYFNDEPRLPSPMLCMLDRITMFAARGGRKGLGAARGEKDVDPAEWFFKAHFFQDPVQPGSLGIEALIQLLQWLMIELSLGDGVVGARFEPVMVGRACTWKYRGQVVPSNARITTEMEVVEIGEDARGVFAIGEGSLWVDGVRIYQVRDLGMRIVADADAPRRAREVLDPAVDGWLGDHRPTWTAPALPMMSMVDRLAGAVRGRVVELADVAVLRWLVFPGGPVELRTVVEGSRVTLFAGNEPVAAGRVLVGEVVAKAPEVMPALVDARTVEDPYASGALFHGPAFRMLRSLRLGSGGASAEVDCAERGVPRGALHQGLLDALTHAIPHDELWRWSSEIDAGVVGYPCRIPSMKLYGEMPTDGVGRVEVRFVGFDGGPRFPKFAIQLIVDGSVRVALTLVEVLLPKGAIGRADRRQRRAFLRDREFVAGLGLARAEADATVVTRAQVAESDWLPGNVARIYGVTGTDVLAEVAVRDHVAQRAKVHPSSVNVAEDLLSATTAERPLRRHFFDIKRSGDSVRVAEERPSARDLGPIEGFWREWLGVGAWPIEDLFLGLVDRFVGDVVLADPDGFNDKVRGRSCLYLANHQVGIESLLFSVIVSALSGAPAVTLAKHEHRQSWIGQLIAHSFDYPGVTDPGLIAFFERDDPASLKRILDGFVAGMARGSGVVVHVEGTRSLTCRRPVASMSSVFLDMALTVGAPIVPVRFVGGLPVEPLEQRLEFPVGFGRQEFWIGGPIEPAQLRPRTLKDRKQLVIDAINGLGPAAAQELPGAPDPAFAAAVAAWQARAAGPERATLLATLDEMTEHRAAATGRLVADARAGQVADGVDAAAQWQARLARWLLGAG